MLKMFFVLKNWKFIFLSFIFVSLLVALGCWQIARGNAKKNLIASYSARTNHHLSISSLNSNQDLRFYQITLKGHFENQKTILLDNKTYQGKVGYEIYTPFKIQNIDQFILIDRGFIPQGEDRAKLPGIDRLIGEITISGMLNLPPHYISLSQMLDQSNDHSALRVEYLNINQLENFFNFKLFPYILMIDPKDPAAYPISWQTVTMNPEKHYAYAFQWFAMALTLLILSALLNKKTFLKKR